MDNSEQQEPRTSKRHQPVQQTPQLDDFDGYTTLSPTPFGMSHHMPIIPEVSTNELHRDKHAIFGEYVAEVLRRLPKSMQPKTTLSIMNVMIEAQEQELTNQSTSAPPTTQTTTENGAK